MNGKCCLFLCLTVTMVLSACMGNKCKIEGLADGFAEGDTMLLSDIYTSDNTCDTVIVSKSRFSAKVMADSARLYKVWALSAPEIQALFFAEPGQTARVVLRADGTSMVSGTEANDAWQQLTDMCNAYEQQVEALVSSFYDDNVSADELERTTEQIRKLDRQKSEWMDDFYERNKGNAMGAFLRDNIERAD